MNRELIHRFFNNDCTEQERNEIRQLLDEQPELLEEYLNESEWEEFLKQDNRKVNEQKRHEIFGAVEQHISRKKAIKKNYGPYAIAASILILFFIGLHVFKPNKITEAIKIEKGIRKLLYVNNSQKDIQVFYLSDSSEITLYPVSSIRLDDSYNQADRKIYLQGGAKFHVHKDRAKPFSVFSGHVETLATGTIFEVWTDQNQTTVKLLEGKVNVYKRANRKDYLSLQPGQEALFIANNNLLSIKSVSPEPRLKEKNAIDANLENRKEMTYYSFSGNAIEFKNVELEHVIRSLEKLYGAKISYPAEFASINMYLSIDTNLGVTHILKNISQMNGLKLVEENDLNFKILKK